MSAAKHIRTSVLDVAYEENGPADGAPVFLMHGFPYDPRCYDDVVPLLTAAGCRSIVPYLRGYGPTRFLSQDTMRSGEQAALGNDLKELMAALRIDRAFLCGYDWGGRACCVVSALWPEHVRGLVTGAGYNVHDVAGSVKPASAEKEHRAWYQYYFHSERGRAGLTENRRDIAKLLWRLWSLERPFDETAFLASAPAFDNPDFVEVVIHSYRVRYGYAPGDPSLAALELSLAAQPSISVPTINLHGTGDGISPPPSADGHARHFTGFYERRLVRGAGHCVPQDAPRETADAVLDLVRRF
ncbi:MAG TPA: alpha/beta hydrolase [Stellaceae bacterium]|nr:alpha/beta hydrolase [Stellaceae bacterium]